MKLLAAKEWNKVFYADGEKYRLQVRAELIHLDGNSSPYFSIGGDIFRLARNGRKVWESGGCIHEEIVKHFPQLQPLVDIHLSDEDGVPMHAYANAAYWAGQTKYQPIMLDTLAKHLRVTQHTAAAMQRQTETRIKRHNEIPEKAWEYVLFNAAQNHIWLVEAERAKSMLNQMEETK